jgi:putative phosphoesterase
MKIAAISDVHGNLIALEAVLADIRARNPDVVVNLGDVLSGALRPRETADRLIPLGLPTIKGNHERQVLTGDPSRMSPSDRMTRAVLLDGQHEWLRNLPDTLWLQNDILLVHGAPHSDMAYFLETVTEQGCRAATATEVGERAGNIDASLILCGHTHIPRAVHLDDGRFIVNPGSVGLQAYEDQRPFPHQMETRSPHARYAIVERVRGAWSVEFCAVDYDWAEAARQAEGNGRFDWIDPLCTGYVRAPGV